MVDDVSVGVQERDNVVDVAFHETNGLLAPLSRIWISILAMNIFAKATAIFSAHGGSVRLQVILFVELGWDLLKYESKYFF